MSQLSGFDLSLYRTIIYRKPVIRTSYIIDIHCICVCRCIIQNICVCRCVGELVKDGTNGFLFSTSSELCDKLAQLGTGFPQNSQLNKFRTEIRARRQNDTWQQVWDREASLLFTRRYKPWTLYAARLSILILGISSVISVLRYMGMGFLLDALLADI